MKTFRFFQNTGGMNLQTNDVLISEQEAEDIINLHADANGSWTSKNIGYSKLNANALESGATVTALYEYIPLTGAAQFIAAVGSKLFTFEPNTGVATEIGSGLDTDSPMQFVTFNGLLIGCNGTDSPKKWNGTGAVTDLNGWPPTIPGITPGNPSIAAIFANRLVFSGDANYPSMIYISALENPENFTPEPGATSAGSIQVSPGDGERITALKPLFLPLENEEVLVVFKERSTYILTGNDADTFSIQKVSDEFGAVSKQSVVLVGNELIFLSIEGITSLSTATLQGNMISGFLSNRIRSLVNQLNPAKLSDSFAVHLRDRREIWWFVAEGSSSQNQRVLVYNYGIQNAWSRRSGITAACGAVIGRKLYTGGYNGFVFQQLKGNSYDGEAIPWSYRTPFYDFSNPRTRKRIKDVEIYLKQISLMGITVKTGWDFNRGSARQEIRTLQVNPDSASALFGAAKYGADTYAVIGSSILRFTPSGSGKLFQLEFSGQEAGKPVELQGWSITPIFGGYR